MGSKQRAQREKRMGVLYQASALVNSPGLFKPPHPRLLRRPFHRALLLTLPQSLRRTGSTSPAAICPEKLVSGKSLTGVPYYGPS